MRISDGLTSSSQSFASRVKGGLFQAHYLHSPPLTAPKYGKLLTTLPPWAALVTQTALMLSAVLHHAVGISGFTKHNRLYSLATVLNPEAWSISPQWLFYVSLSLLLFGSCCYITEVAMTVQRCKSKLPISVYRLYSFLLSFLHRVCLYPFLRICLLQSINGTEAWARVAGTAAVLWCGGVLGVRLAISGDNNWYLRQANMYSKVGCSFEVQEIAISAVIVGIGVISEDSSSPFAPCGVVLLAAFLLYQLLAHQQYLNSTMLSCKCVQYFLIAWLSVCIVLGRFWNSILLTMLVFLMVAPCLCVFLIVYIGRTTKRWAKCEDCETQWEFEVALRNLLARYYSGDFDEASLKLAIMVGVKRFQTEKKSHLIFSQFYFYVRQESEYALLRLACAHSCPSQFVSDYQVCHFFQRVSEATVTEERRYLEYISHYRSAIAADFELCVAAHSLFTELLRANTTVSRLEHLFAVASRQVKSVEVNYSAAQALYPLDPTIKMHHNSLLTDLFFEKPTTGSTSSPSKANNSQVSEYTALDTGIFIISCHFRQFGKIVFANHNCGRILSAAPEDIEGRDLNDFLPPPFSLNHNQVLANFISAGEVREVFRSHLFLYAEGKFSVEVTFRFRPTGFRGVPYFIVAMKGKPHIREFALFDSNFIVTSHSRYFANVIQVPVPPVGVLNGQSLLKLLPGIERKLGYIDTSTTVLYRHPDSGIIYHLMFAKTTLGTGVVRWVYIFCNEKDVRKLIESNSIYREEMNFRAGAKDYQAVGKLTRSDEGMAPSLKKTESKKIAVSVSSAISVRGVALRKSAHVFSRLISISLFLGFLTSVLVAFANLVLALGFLDQTYTSVSDSNLLFAPLHLSRVAYLSRCIDLADEFVYPGNVTSDLLDELSSLSRGAGDIGNGDFVEVWEAIDGEVSSRRLGLATAVGDFLTHASHYVAASQRRSDDLFFIYRNGLGELLRTLQSRSRISLISAAELLPYFLGTSIVAICVLGLSLVLAAKGVLALFRTRSAIWNILTCLTTEQLLTVLHIHNSRLSQVHNFTVQLPVHSSRRLITRRKTFELSTWYVLAGLYAAVTAGALAVGSWWGYSRVEDLLSQAEGEAVRAGIAAATPTLAGMMIREAALDIMSGSGYLHIVPTGQLFPRIQTAIESSLESFLRDIDSIMESLQYFQNLDLLEFYLSTLCTDIASLVPSCNHSVFSLGIEATVHEYAMSLHAVLQELLEKESLPFSVLAAVHTETDVLTSALQSTYAHSLADFSQEISTFRTYTSLAFTGYSVFILLLYLCVYRREGLKLRRRCTDLWRVSQLVPSADN